MNESDPKNSPADSSILETHQETLSAETGSSQEIQLETDAADWTPDHTASGTLSSAAETPNSELLSEASLTPPSLPQELEGEWVALVQDPYALFNPSPSSLSDEAIDSLSEEEIESLEAELEADSFESTPEELEEEANDELEPEVEFDLEGSDAALERMAQSMAQEEAKMEAEQQALLSELQEQAADRLAQEIAEDQALAAAQAAESEAAEEIDPELLAALPRRPKLAEGQTEQNLDLSEIESCCEALLFMSDKPVSAQRLKDLLGPDFDLQWFEQALSHLQERYQSVHHGFELVQIAGGYQFRTKAGRAALAKKLAKVTQQRLSTGGMETLSIIAYKQPVLKDDIDKIRGVDSSHFIRGLMDKKLIAIQGRSDLPGRPMLYTTTSEFLELFGLNALSDLPPLRELEQMVPGSQVGEEQEDPRVREMRKLVAQMKSDTSTTLLYDPKEDEKILSEIRERVNTIPTSTPYLDEQKAAEKQAALQAKLDAQAAAQAAIASETPAENLFAAAEQAAWVTEANTPSDGGAIDLSTELAPDNTI